MYKLWRLFSSQLDRSKVKQDHVRQTVCLQLPSSHKKIFKLHEKNVLEYMAKDSIHLKANETAKSKWEASTRKDLVTAP